MRPSKIILISFIGLLPIITWGAVPVDLVRQSLRTMMTDYPQSTLLDIYKSAFQNRYGPGHIVADADKAKQYLDWELQQPFKHENPPYEPTMPDGRYYRVNLSVITDSIVPYEVFFDAFLESVHDIAMPTIAEWSEDWTTILHIMESLHFDLPDYETDKAAISARLVAGIFQGEHSRAYVNAYDPHYRIIRKDIFEQQLKPLIDEHLNLLSDSIDANHIGEPQ